MKKNIKVISLLLVMLLLSISLMACGQTEKIDEGSKDTEKETTEVVESKDDAEKETTEVAESKDDTEKVEETEAIPFTVATLKGPTGMGMVKLMDEVDKGENKMGASFSITGVPDELVGKIINDEIDFACLPTNLAAVLYNKTGGKIQLAAVNTMGVLYMVEVGDEINSISDLKGKKIFANGQGSTPEFVLRYLLEKNDINPDEDVELNFSLQHSELATATAAGDVNLALLPQPHVTVATMQNKDARIALDLTKEWENIEGNDSELAMGCIVVKKEFAEKNPEVVEEFLNSYKQSVEWVNANNKDAAELIAKYGILPKAPIAEKALPNCNIVYREAEEAKQTLNGFYKILFDFNPKSLGGKLPDEGFYYNK
jgi:NitT/TauT family transport system substrate-binding protein